MKGEDNMSNEIKVNNLDKTIEAIERRKAYVKDMIDIHTVEVEHLKNVIDNTPSGYNVDVIVDKLHNSRVMLRALNLELNSLNEFTTRLKGGEQDE
jgi:hypothetical protein